MEPSLSNQNKLFNNNEKEYLKTIFSMRRIEEKDAHDILDGIS